MKETKKEKFEREMMEENRRDLIKMIETIKNPVVIKNLRAMAKGYLSNLEVKNAAPTDQSKSCI